MSSTSAPARKTSLRAWLGTRFALVVALPLLAVAVLVWLSLLPQLRDDVGIRHEALARAISGQITAHLSGASRELGSLARLVDAPDRSIAAGRTELLDAHVGAGDMFDAIYLVDGGDGISSIGLPEARRAVRSDLLGLDLSRRRFVRQARSLKSEVWSESFLSTVTGRLAVALVIPRADDLLIGEVAIDRLSEFISRLPSESGLVTLILDNQGVIVADSRNKGTGEHVDAATLSVVKLARTSGVATRDFQIEGVAFIGTAVKVPGVDWTVLVAQPTQVAFRPITSTLGLLAAGGGGALLLAFGAAWLLARSIARRFASHIDQARAIAQGDYPQDWPESGIREFAELATNLHRMSRAIREREDELRRSEERFRSIVSNAPVMIFEFDDAGLFKLNEGRGLDVLGLTPGQLVGASVVDFLRDTPEAGEHIRRALAGEPRQFTARLESALFETYLNPVKDPRAPGTSVIGVAVDVTARKLAEERLREASEELERFFTSSLELLCIADVDGYFRRLNPEWKSVLGYEMDELLDRRFLDFVHPDDIEATLTAIADLNNQNAVLSFTNRYRRKDGAYRWLEWRSFPVGRYVYAAARDITGHLMTEQALREGEARYRELFEANPHPMWVYDLETLAFLAVNDAAVAHYGYSREEFLAMTILDIRPPEDAGALLDNVKAVTAGVDEAGVWRHRTRDGRVIRVEIVSHTLDFAGHRAEVVLANDVTDRLRAEARLKESEQKFRGIVQNAHAVIFILDREGIFLLSEGRGLARLGLKPGQVVGQSALDLYAPYPSVVEGIRKALAGELIQTTNDLSGNIYDTVYSPYFDEAGQVRGVIGIAIDITERRQAEEALRLTQFTVDKARDAIYWVDADARIFYVNEAACRALGYSREELLGLTVFDIAPGARDGWRDHWRDTTQRDAYLIEATHQTKDGRVFPVEISISVMRLPDRMFHCDFVRDISERRQAEQALRESEEKFRTLYENMTEGVALHELVHDEQGRVVDYRVLDVNPAFSRQCGIPAEMARGRTARDLYRTDAAPYLEEFAAVAGGGKPVIFDTYFATLDRHFRISAISPQAGRFATVFEDITERKQREAELQEKTDELMRFTYTVSHDLKSPLVTIRTFLGFLEQDLEKRDAERIAKDMGFMRNASEKMTRLLDELLELSRIGRMVNAPVDVSLQELAREALDLVAGRIASRGIRVRVDDAPVLVRGDRPRLVEVFQNLIDNAAKFMGDQTEPLIEIGVEDTRQGLAFFVRDNGEGIDSRHMHKLFGLFEKLNPDAEGTGIGLALVKRIVEVHGGRIWVESPGLGRGATFRFTLAGAKRAS